MSASRPFADLSHKLDAAQRVPRSDSKLVLQVVAIQLRVWLADQNDVACRPWYILCLELYPRGKVLNQRLHSPASQKPPASAFLSFVLDHIVSPPEGEKCLRPTHVSFVEKETTDSLCPMMEKLKIETSTLTLPDGIDQYVRLFSDKLLEMDKASRGEASERPGILSVQGITPEMGGNLSDAAVQMYRAGPWRRIPEHVALEIRFPSMDEGSQYRDRYYVTVLGSDEKAYGFALMPSLSELRAKYRRAVMRRADDGEEDDRDGGGISKLRGDMTVCGACGKRVGDGVMKDGVRYVDRCGGCKRLLYCEERCQRLDWRSRHRHECQQATTDPDYVFKRREWAWLDRELALLFLDPTSVPFDDLDANEQYGWKFIDRVSPPLYPMPFVTVQSSTSTLNRMDRPSPKELIFMTLVARALTECVSPPPKGGTLHLASGVSISFAENLAQSLHSPI